MKKNQILIKSGWTSWDTALLSAKLYRHVENGEIEIEIKAKKGSTEADFVVNVLANATYDLVKFAIGVYIWNRMFRRSNKGVELTPVAFQDNERTYWIKGKENDEFPPKRYREPYYISALKDNSKKDGDEDGQKYLPKK